MSSSLDATLFGVVEMGMIDLVGDSWAEGNEVSFTNELGQTRRATLHEGHNRIRLNAYHTYRIRQETTGKNLGTYEIECGQYETIEVRGLRPYKIYGVTWDGTATQKLSRTDDAVGFTDPVAYKAGMTAGEFGSPFDTLYPWCEIKRVEDPAAGSLVEVPKFWYKWSFPISGGISLKILDTDPALCGLTGDGWHVDPWHMDRHDGKGERDIVYGGRYHCANNYKSVSGQSPRVNTTIGSFRSGITALGEGIYMNDLAMRETIWMLYLVEYADWNSQRTIGAGCGNNSAVQAMGASDSMPYHTGTMQATREAYGVETQYRYFEDLWGNCRDDCDGFYFDNNNIWVGINPTLYADSTANKVKLGGWPAGGNCITSWANPKDYTSDDDYAWCIFAKTASGKDFTVYCADFSYSASGNAVLVLGGGYVQHPGCGLFCLNSYAVSDTFASVGSRLQKLP